VTAIQPAATGTKEDSVTNFNSRRRRRIAAVILLATVSAVAAGLASASPARADYTYLHVANAMTVQAQVLALILGTNAIGGDAPEPMPLGGEKP
jgi:hypothetical protein